MLHFLGNMLSPGGEHGRLTILIYHRALAAPDPILQGDVDAETFDGHMRILAAEFQVLPLGEACARLARGNLPARAACITFDDGYADNEQVALPILLRHKLPATFFVASGYAQGGIMFNDAAIEAVRRAPSGVHDLSRLGLGVLSLDGASSRRATIDFLLEEIKYLAPPQRDDLVQRLASELGTTLPGNLMMSPAQILRLHKEGMEIGSHTVSHPILMTLEERQARAEIIDGKRQLEDIIGAPVRLFAYPNGKPGRDYGPRDVRLVREAGFAAAVSTIGGVARRGNDPFQLPRFSPWDRNPRRLAVRMLASCARRREVETA